MPRSEAQKAADKRYRETHKKDYIKWATWLKPDEAAKIDKVIKENGMNKAELLRWAMDELQKRKYTQKKVIDIKSLARNGKSS